jgi:serine phosphatase RsbU (regulator of sigma subunit)
MFNPVAVIPSQYQEEFFCKQAKLIKSRVLLLCILILTIYFGSILATWLSGSVDFSPQETPVAALLVITCALILYVNHKSATISLTKLNACVFTALILFLLTKLNIIYYQFADSASTLYLLTLFLISFTIPWRVRDVLVISLMHCLAYVYLFFYFSNFSLPGQRGALDFGSFSDGIILLGIGLAFCMVMRRKEYRREVENFILLKEVEEKNDQMRRELELATRIHKTLIPKSMSTDLVDVAVMYLPMYYIGGDYAKFHFVDKDKLIFIICDITGHGVSAALLVNRIHAEFERLAHEGKSPGALLKELNDFIVEDFQGINMYLSAFCCELDFKEKTVTFSNHGHPSQYMYKVTDSVVSPLESQASLMGIPLADDGVYQRVVGFNNGDRILLFTDGVIETRGRDGSEFGQARLENFIRKNHGLDVDYFNRQLYDQLRAFRHEPFEDDIFIVNIRIK